MIIIKQLRREIEAYDGPLPATGSSIEEVWLRGAVKQLYALERKGAPYGDMCRELGRFQ